MGACCETNRQRKIDPIQKNPYAQITSEDFIPDYPELELPKSRSQTPVSNQTSIPLFNPDDWTNVVLFEELIDMIINLKTEDVIKYLEQRSKRTPICLEAIRGKIEPMEIKVDEQIINTQMWSPILYAVAFKQLDLVKFIVEKLGIHSSLCLKEPIYDSERDGVVIKDSLLLQSQMFNNAELGQTTKGKFWNSALSLMLAAKNYDMPMLDYLWNDLYYLWEIADLDQLIDCLYNCEFLDALPNILKGKAFRSIILSMNFEDQVFYLEKLLFDKFDKDTQFSIASFIDDALTNKDFATQYLYINLKREIILKDLLDVCLHNSNHLMINQNGDLFHWVFQKVDPDVKIDLTVIEALVKNIIKGNRTVSSMRQTFEEILRCSRYGNLKKLQNLILINEIREITMIKDKLGEVLPSLKEKDELIKLSRKFNKEASDDILQEWNPLHIAIFFNQMEVIAYYCDELKINLKQSLIAPGQREKRNAQSTATGSSPLIKFILECYKRQLRQPPQEDLIPEEALLYFWKNHGSIFNQADLKYLVETLYKINKRDLLKYLIYYPTSVQIIKALPFEKRLEYLSQIQSIGIKYELRELQLSEPNEPKDNIVLSEKEGKSSRISIRAPTPSGYESAQPSKDDQYLINDLLSERPYSLYFLIMNLKKSPYYFKRSYQRINAQDIEEVTRCSLERVIRISELLNLRELRGKITQEFPQYSLIKRELKQFISRIEHSQVFQERHKVRRSMSPPRKNVRKDFKLLLDDGEDME